MRCCTCASGCAASTTNSRKDETNEEKEMDLHCARGDRRNDPVHVPRRRSGESAVELAAAVAVQRAADHVLAGHWTARAVPDSRRRLRTSWRPPRYAAAADC